MAVAKMSRLRLVGLKTEQNRIMNVLIRSGLFEVSPTSDCVAGSRGSASSHLDRVTAKQAKVSFAVNFLSSLSVEMLAAIDKNKKELKRDESVQPIEFDYSAPKAPKSRAMIGYDDFYDVAAKEYELISVCDTLEKISFEKLEIKSKIGKLENIGRNLEPYESCPVPFSRIADTRHAFVLLAAGPVSSRPTVLSDFDVFTETYPSSTGALLFVVGKLTDKEKVSALLAEDGFTLCPYRYDLTARELLRENRGEAAALKEKSLALIGQGLKYERYLTELKVLYDVLGQEIEKSTAELNFVKTRDTFVIEGWVPADAADKILDSVRNKTENIVYSLSDPGPDDSPPTLMKNSKVMGPYEDVTNMYSVPAYGEMDPNPFMAVFFFVFFGIMLGDAGYGLVLSIVCGLALRLMKPEKGTARLIALVGMGGLSAIVWGLLFGGVFAIQGIPALWFNPMDDPIMMLALSLILGCVQILFGYALHSVKLFAAHKPLDAVFDSLFIYLLFGGIACLALNMLLKLGATLNYVGFGLLIAALAGILLTGGRHNKGILKKFMGGFSGLYGLVNLASDVLSYARIFGLGLASGAIGYAFNILAGMLFGIPGVGYAIGFLLLIPLHAFNIGIGVLGAYVHNARLQFLEFYGKFYDGGGRLFSPMGEKTKYVRFA